MSRLGIRHEWVAGSGTGQPELDGTFARLQLLLDGNPIARVFDKLANTTSDDLLVPTYPLAEWIAARWWPLLREAAASDRGEVDDAFLERHSLMHVGEGFAYPDLRIASDGDGCRIEYVPGATAFQTIDYIGTALDATVSRDDAEQFVTDVVTVTLARLAERGISGTWLQEEWDRIVSVDVDEREFCTAAAWLGLDPFDIDEATAASIMMVWAELPTGLREDTFRASTPTQLQAAADWVMQGSRLTVAESNTVRSGEAGEKWADLRGADRAPIGANPVREGQLLARQVRDRLDAGSGKLAFGDEVGPIPVIEAVAPPLKSVNAVAGWGGGESGPCCFAPRRANTTQRFAQARTLFEYLTVPDGGSAALLSSARTGRQQAGRVFAAELLAPIGALARLISSPEVGLEQANDLAATFDVSPLVIVNQIRNNRLARVTTW